jgi:hypothetical protein
MKPHILMLLLYMGCANPIFNKPTKNHQSNEKNMNFEEI